MDAHVEGALKIYGKFLDGGSSRMNEMIIQAIKAIREYVFLRDPNDQEIHRVIIMAKREKLSGTELEALVRAIGSPGS